jgi:transcriptional regulator with XRE-family HTH domain
MMLGMSQTTLAQALGLTFQQIQKYEKGTNRIGASRIQHIAQILQVPISFLFEGVQKPERREDSSYVSAYLTSSDGLALTRAFTKIDDAALRRCIVKLVEGIADQFDT